MSDKKLRDPVQRLASGLRDLHDRHRDRHRATGFGFTFADRIDYLDPEKWDAVTRGQSVFLGREVLRVIENHGPTNIQTRYAIIFQQDTAVCCLAAQIVTVSGDRLGKEVTKANKHFKNFFRRTIRERILVAGNLVSWGFHGIAFAAGIDAAPLWPAVAEALYRIRRSERLIGQTDFVMIKDLTPDQAGQEVLRRFSYRPLETEPNMVLMINPA